MRRATAILLVCLAAVAVFGETARPRTDLNLRATPAVRKSNVITVLGPADTFEILETRRGWCRVRVLSTGAEGWVSKKYIEPVAYVPVEEPVRSSGGGGMATAVLGALVAALLAAIGYAAGHQPLEGAKRNPIPVFIVSLVIGTFYVGLTLPKGLMTLGTEREWMTVARLGEWSLALNQSLAGGLVDFQGLMRFIVWAVVLYLASLMFLALRHGQLGLFGWGAATLTISTAILHMIIWGGYIIAKVVMFVWWLLSKIGGFLMWVVQSIFGFLFGLIAGLYRWIDELLGGYGWLAFACLAIVLVAMVVRSQGSAGDLFKILGKALLFVSGAGVVIWVFRWIWPYLEPVIFAIAKFIAAIAGFLVMLVMRLLAGIVILLAVATIGQLLLDQIHGALSAGRRRRGVIIGAIAIGTSIAILLFISNLYGVSTWLPTPAMEFAGKYLHQPAPLLDALIALAIVALSIVGVWRNVPALGKEPTTQEFGKSLVYSIAGVFFAGALVAIAGQTEE